MKIKRGLIRVKAVRLGGKEYSPVEPIKSRVLGNVLVKEGTYKGQPGTWYTTFKTGALLAFQTSTGQWWVHKQRWQAKGFKMVKDAVWPKESPKRRGR